MRYKYCRTNEKESAKKLIQLIIDAGETVSAYEQYDIDCIETADKIDFEIQLDLLEMHNFSFKITYHKNGKIRYINCDEIGEIGGRKIGTKIVIDFANDNDNFDYVMMYKSDAPIKYPQSHGRL